MHSSVRVAPRKPEQGTETADDITSSCEAARSARYAGRSATLKHLEAILGRRFDLYDLW
jgi:hypothetical protein